ncbi:MAG: RNA 2',3'-cyclic phosphodiesterase [Candidatus Thermoplasmatota archaeon]|nr:RNA 2',3'-cyclic phosphodiesterase [Candidatus Thermoplasmatota archaeon]
MTFRGFISIDVEANDKVHEFIDELERTRAPLNMVDPSQLHMTVKFLGDEIEEDKIDEIVEKTQFALKGFEPFELDMRGTGAFPHLGFMKVVWIDSMVSPDDPQAVDDEDISLLENIAHRVEEELVPLGFERDDREFSPHITVARVKGGKNKEKLRDVIEKYDDEYFTTCKIDELKLKKSVLKKSGPEYNSLETISL